MTYINVTKNATGLGFTKFGEIDMSADWWDQQIKVLFNKLIVTEISFHLQFLINL